jgi:GPN-loop GTPase
MLRLLLNANFNTLLNYLNLLIRQIELSTHMHVLRDLVHLLQSWDFRVCVVFLLDSQFITDMSKFFSGLMVASMINIEVPTFNILTKTDLLDKQSKKQLEKFLEPDSYLLDEEFNGSDYWGRKYKKLTQAFGTLVDDYSLIKFMPINVFEEDSLNEVLLCINNALQVDENEEVRVHDFDQTIDGDNGLNGKEISIRLRHKRVEEERMILIHNNEYFLLLIFL